MIDYCAAKAALTNFCKALSKEVGPRGVRVNTVSPGPVATDLWLGDLGVADAVGRRQRTRRPRPSPSGRRQPSTGRFTPPDEVADLVALLASDRAANVTGADFSSTAVSCPDPVTAPRHLEGGREGASGLRIGVLTSIAHRTPPRTYGPWDRSLHCSTEGLVAVVTT